MNEDLYYLESELELELTDEASTYSLNREYPDDFVVPDVWQVSIQFGFIISMLLLYMALHNS